MDLDGNKKEKKNKLRKRRELKEKNKVFKKKINEPKPKCPAMPSRKV
jgi:hypothetical protein